MKKKKSRILELYIDAVGQDVFEKLKEEDSKR